MISAAPADDARPIGVFDSGVGGLSVLAALRERMPREDFVYFGDMGHAPYGERGDDYVAERTLTVARTLIDEHRIKALVVACNTATAAAIHLLRDRWPVLPVVGLEPALKPAVASTRTGHVAVLATRGTLSSQKFARLRAGMPASVEVRAVPCDGLASAIERDDTARVEELAARYMQAAGPLGDAPGAADVVVLGCTHYPFALAALRAHAPAGLRFIDTGVPVAQHTARLLEKVGLLRHADEEAAGGGENLPVGKLALLSSAAPEALNAAAARWLKAPTHTTVHA